MKNRNTEHIIKNISEKKWYILETRMNHEKKVRTILEKMGFTCYIASQVVTRQWSQRKKKVEKILIPMKIFVFIPEGEKRNILGCAQGLRFMTDRANSRSAIVREDEINALRMMLDFAPEEVFQEETFRCGERVRIINGPLKGLEGIYTDRGRVSKICIQIQALGTISTEIPLTDVCRIDPEI